MINVIVDLLLNTIQCKNHITLIYFEQRIKNLSMLWFD